MTSLNVNWVKSTNNLWLPLARVNLYNVTAQGVYIIWYSGLPGQVVRVGQGDIKDRLKCHQTDPEVQAYARRGELLVTWASVPQLLRGGVERYLAEKLNPLVGKRFPDVSPVFVNSPW